MNDWKTKKTISQKSTLTELFHLNKQIWQRCTEHLISSITYAICWVSQFSRLNEYVSSEWLWLQFDVKPVVDQCAGFTGHVKIAAFGNFRRRYYGWPPVPVSCSLACRYYNSATNSWWWNAVSTCEFCMADYLTLVSALLLGFSKYYLLYI